MKKTYFWGLEKKALILIVSLFVFTNLLAQTEFITTWDTTLPGPSGANSISIPAIGGTYDVDLGNDGSYELLDQTGTITIDVTSHGYASGVIQVAMRNAISATGNLERIYFNNSGDRQKILSVDQWGSSIAWTSMFRAYWGCRNLNVTATDAPDLSIVTNMGLMFRECTALTSVPSFNLWDVSNATSMVEMFFNATNFNTDLGNWIPTSVTSFSRMFSGATAFQGNGLNNWNNHFTGSNISMSFMFENADAFNADITGWVTTNVVSMTAMFQSNNLFNREIGSWDVSNVTSMYSMFRGATMFNADLSNWVPTSCTNFTWMFFSATAFQGIGLNNWNNHFTASPITMSGMFRNADALTGDITGWVTTNVTNMAEMFMDNNTFNQEIGNWNVSNVIAFTRMFQSAHAFNGDLGNWTPTSCTNFVYMFNSAIAFQGTNLQLWNNHFDASPISMFGMFRNADALTGDITGWDTTNVTNMREMFRDNGIFNQEIGAWDVSNVISMREMFQSAVVFNGDLGNWQPVSVTDFTWMFNSAIAFQGTNLQMWNNHFDASPISMFGMFRNADALMGDITGWVTTNVTNMREMFEANNIFNQEIGNWDVSNVISMYEMFNGADVFDADLGNWMPTSCTNFFYMFNSAVAYQGTNLQMWNNHFDASPISMFGMFRNADALTGDITGWVTTNVTNMREMFEANNIFNQEIGNWDVSNVVTMHEMFNGANMFDADLGNWMPTSCTNFFYMFNSAVAYQGTNLQMWNNHFDASPISMFGMFRNADALTGDITGWVTTNVTNMREMFEANNAIDQDLGNWDMNNVTNGVEMFNGSGMSITNWDNTLIGWHSQGFTNSNVTIGASGVQYCDATIQRDAMQDDGIFNFVGDLQACIPGGVPTGAIMWYRANNGAFENGTTLDPAEDGDSVVSWFDNGDMVLEAIPVGTAPTFTENFLNFNPGISFNGSPLDPEANVLSTGIDTDHHVVAVYIGADQNANFFATGNDDTTTNEAMFYGLESGGSLKQDFTGNGFNTAVAASTPTIVNFDYNYTLVDDDPGPPPVVIPDLGSRTISINGTDVATDNLVEPNILNLNPAFERIGGSFVNPAEDFSGVLAELIVYPGRQADSDRRRIQTYLGVKYGITLDPDNDGSGGVSGTEGDYLASDGTTIVWDHSALSAYHNNVAGIGRDDVTSLNQKQAVSSNPGALVTMGNMSISTTNAVNPNDFPADLSYMLWGNDGGNTALSETINGDPCLQRMERIWAIAETGTVGTVTLRVPQSLFPNFSPTLLVSNDAAFDNTDTFIPLTDDGSGNYQATVDFTNGQFFSFAEHSGMPIAICQDITIQLDATGNATITAVDIDNGSSSCLAGTVSLSADITTFDCTNIGPNTVTLTVTDSVSGLTSTCTATVTVEDVTDPIAVCQDITINLDASGNASITGSDIDGGSTDSCGIASLTASPNTFTVADLGPNNVTLTVTDNDGNTDTCIAVVTVQGAPTAVCQDITVQLDATGNVTIVAADVDGGSTAPGGIASMSVTPDTFDCSNIGTNTVTLTVTAISGLTDTCTAVVTVEDDLPPTAMCQDITVQLDATGNASITAADVDNGSSDNCGIASLSVTPSMFTCADVGANTVTLTITDVNGNTSTCTSTVTVEDNVLPTAICQDITVQLDATGNASITAADVDNGSSDNCGIASLSVTPSTFTCADVGANTVTLTVTDVNGNASTCTSTVTVEDNVLPTAICQDITVQLDAAGNASITATDVDNGSIDNCGIASLAVSPNTFTCADVGANTVTLVVTDVNGNTATCTSIITVEDNVPPVAVCQDITIQLDANGEATITPADVDGGSTDACGIASLSVDITDFTCADIGSNVVTLTVTDINGNAATCTAAVTVEDNVPPIISCPIDVVTDTDPGLCTAMVTFSDAIAIDACGIQSVVQTAGLPSGSEFPVGVSTVEFTATDSQGNITICTFNITVEDIEPPVVICQDIVIALDETGVATITAVDVLEVNTDNCGVATSSIDMDTFDCSNIGDNLVTVTVTDIHGNSSTCTAVVTIEDITAPTPQCMDITVQLDATGTTTIAPSDLDGGSTDACGVVNLSIDIDTFGCDDVGDNVVTLTVTDSSGNTASCTAIVTVEDSIAPELVCMDITVALDENGTATITPEDVMANNTDACGILTTGIDIDEFSCDDIGTPITVMVFSQDVNGNLSSCTAIVTVVDTLPPVITCPQDITVDPGPGNLLYEVPDYFATGEASAIDNCTDPVVLTTQDPAPGTLLPDGVYVITLTATDDNGNTATCTFELTVDSVLGVEDLPIDLSTIVIYPNPTVDIIYISNPQSLMLNSLLVYDTTGRLVQTSNLQSIDTTSVLDVSRLPSATYMLIINSEDGQIVKQFIKE